MGWIQDDLREVRSAEELRFLIRRLQIGDRSRWPLDEVKALVPSRFWSTLEEYFDVHGRLLPAPPSKPASPIQAVWDPKKRKRPQPQQVPNQSEASQPSLSEYEPIETVRAEEPVTPPEPEAPLPTFRFSPKDGTTLEIVRALHQQLEEWEEGGGEEA